VDSVAETCRRQVVHFPGKGQVTYDRLPQTIAVHSELLCCVRVEDFDPGSFLGACGEESAVICEAQLLNRIPVAHNLFTHALFVQHLDYRSVG